MAEPLAVAPPGIRYLTAREARFILVNHPNQKDEP